MDNKRDITVDLLKTLGILLIFLAHINPPMIIFQLRNFDVVLLVILSSLLADKSYKKCKNYFEYVKKRFIRLIIPVWIFLTVFFIGITACTYPNITYSFKEIINSYLLIDGIGYVWIFRVYFLGAVITPILLKLKEKSKNKRNVIILILILIYILYEVVYAFIGNKGLFLTNIIYYIIPYGLCIALGLQLKEINNKTIIKISTITILMFLAIFILTYCIFGTIETTNSCKYPPRIYYLSYAVGCSLLIYYFVDRKNVFNIKAKLDIKIIKFIASHTMWIYLWHVFYLLIINNLFKDMVWIVKLFILVILSTITTYIQSKIVRKLNNKSINIILDC